MYNTDILTVVKDKVDTLAYSSTKKKKLDCIYINIRK